jgi:hypothetical protein
MQRPSRFACYYGLNRLERLADYDLVILQAEHYTLADMLSLRERGTLPLGYLSLSEVAETESAAPWVLRDARNLDWNTVLVDCRSEAWQQFVVEERIPYLAQRGIRGFFLDTVDVPEQYAEILPGVESLLRRIRARHPNLVLLVNRGFSVLDTLASVADGVVFESFTTYHDGPRYAAWTGRDLLWTARMAVRVQQALGTRPILTIDYAAPDDVSLRRQAEQRARAYGFTPFVSTYQLDGLP